MIPVFAAFPVFLGKKKRGKSGKRKYEVVIYKRTALIRHPYFGTILNTILLRPSSAKLVDSTHNPTRTNQATTQPKHNTIVIVNV